MKVLYKKRKEMEESGKGLQYTYSQVFDFSFLFANYIKLSHHFQGKYTAFTGNDEYIEQSN